MNRISSFHIAIAALFISQFGVFGHEIKSASASVHRLHRSMDDESLSLQQSHHKKSTSDAKNDNIVFEHDDVYSTKSTERIEDAPLFPPSLGIRSNALKANETNHQYSGKANGEYEFRQVESFVFY